ncbi:DUF4112 domain-containing protein [Algirhabdus cladophorae]|uniref:DUF4112 domain-containing protein n=1 Tax=Algirhabdus cladophorae TaxID=3377108 RepID=UPI003B849F20
MKPNNFDFSLEDTAEIERLERLAYQLDSLFLIPVVNLRVGVENILSLIPVVGDVLSIIPSLLIVHRASALGTRPLTKLHMMFNIALDLGIGLIPLVGDLFDIAWNANLRNVALVRRDMTRRYEQAADLAPVAQN